MKILFALLALLAASMVGAAKPNVIVILCDDLGYGDVKCNNPEGKIATPNFDRVAREGVRFTDAHTSSSVCTPTRYGLLTGRYNWRTKLQTGVLGGLSPRLIEQGRMTVASMLREQGYRTAVIGKWHLGMDWAKLPGKEVSELSIETPEQVRNVDYTAPIQNGPNSVGFDYYFGISASLDMVPYTFIENDKVVAAPTEDRALTMMAGDESRKSRLGPAATEFEAEDVLPTITKKAVEYIGQHWTKEAVGKPFFLYLPLASPHTPIAPSAAWLGKSGLTPYADFVMETDWAIGQVLEALDKGGIAKDTLLIVTSDNGCSPAARIDQLRKLGHAANGPLRGHKADIWEGGHRVPLLVRWPARTQPAVSDQLVCLTDILATVADAVGVKVPDTAGEDSYSFLPVLTGFGKAARDAAVHHSISGAFAIRQGPWKLALCPGSGGWSMPRDPQAVKQGLADTQLYAVGEGDLGEQRNVAKENPEVVSRLTTLLEKYVAEGRSTAGEPQKNAVEVVLRKPIPAAQGKGKR